jgi:hypothetical protein
MLHCKSKLKELSSNNGTFSSTKEHIFKEMSTDRRKCPWQKNSTAQQMVTFSQGPVANLGHFPGSSNNMFTFRLRQ